MSKLEKLTKKPKPNVNLVIEVTRNSGIQLPPVEGLEKPEERDGLMLLPGQNDVSKECWEAALKNPGMKILLRGGYLSNRGEGQAVPIITDWNALPLRRAEEVLNQIDEAETVHKIKAEAKKKQLVSLCEARLDQILEEQEAANI
jgi:hypothetical protein